MWCLPCRCVRVRAFAVVNKHTVDSVDPQRARHTIENSSFYYIYKSSPGFSEQIMPILFTSCDNCSLVTWAVVSLTAAKFKSLMFFFVCVFALHYASNMVILKILYDLCLLPAQFYYKSSQSHYDRRSVCQSVLVSSPIWSQRPAFCYCQTFMVSSMWGALCDERMGLSFVAVIVKTSIFTKLPVGILHSHLSRVRFPVGTYYLEFEDEGWRQKLKRKR
jgi:hypothetical protein